MKIQIEKSDKELKREDFVSDQMVKWCPGCGNHAILATLSNVLPKIGYKKEKYVMVSGIGCSSRFPYYVNTYGFHGIHGRANAIATGLKIANPGLSVWVNTGDGDSTAIGGNHFIHVIRRNMDLNIILFNNQIYGLTKGQYSPTSPLGAVTKTSPLGTIENPFIPGELVMGAQGTFFARVPDNNIKLMAEAMEAASAHEGCSVIEVLDNCIIFNDKAHEQITGRDYKDDAMLVLEDGKPMIFGKERNKGIRLNGTELEVVEIGKNGISESDILVHNAKNPNSGIHTMLAKMRRPDFPVAVGILRDVEAPTYNQLLEDQMEEAHSLSKCHTMDELLNSGDTWEI